jgi:hypothetical protein
MAENDKINLKGYVVCRISGQLWHRVVYKNKIGPIPKNWVVHHINFNKQDNRAVNLIAMPVRCHNQFHRCYGRVNGTDRLVAERFLREFLKRHKTERKTRTKIG